MLEHKEGLTHREVQLAADVVAEGRALLLVVNKLDALPEEGRSAALRLIEGAVERALPEVTGGAAVLWVWVWVWVGWVCVGGPCCKHPRRSLNRVVVGLRLSGLVGKPPLLAWPRAAGVLPVEQLRAR